MPVVLVFASGVIKYGESTGALYLASLKKFKESSIKSPNQPDRVNLAGAVMDGEASSEEIPKWVFNFFHNFKGLIVDKIQNYSQRLESREFFQKHDADLVVKVIVTERNMVYEDFYSKIILVNSSS